MTDQERWRTVEDGIRGTLLVNGVLTMALSAVIAIVNQEQPEFKVKCIAAIKQISSSSPPSQAMIDGAVKLFE